MNPNLYVSFDKVNQFSKRDIALQLEEESLASFQKYKASIDSFPQVIIDKSKEDVNRPVLVEVLEKQYDARVSSDLTKNNIESLLSERTFTVTTAHQPSFLTGPLYFIYKIFSTINLSESLQKSYPNYKFVPVFVLGGEDHDFEEVNHVHMFGNTFTWDSGQKGAVGRMDFANMVKPLDEVFEKMGFSVEALKLKSIIQKSFRISDSYGTFTLDIIHALFDQYGLLCLSMDDSLLKNELKSIFRNELLNRNNHLLVEAEQSKIIDAGYKKQVHAREINLFYLKGELRNRITYRDESYHINDTDLVFSEKEILDELDHYPERFSPNVILRPLYQEKILPNLCYVGGGGELAYWQELRSVFDKNEINFPMLLRRDSVMIVDTVSMKLVKKLDLDLEDILEEEKFLIDQYISSAGDLSLDVQKMEIEKVFINISKKAIDIDQGLEGMIASIKIKQIKSLDQIAAKFRKSIKIKEEVKLKQLSKLWNRLYPNGNLQERYDNFIPYYLMYGDLFFEKLKKSLNPLDKRFKVFIM